jgi:hypothetical protein
MEHSITSILSTASIVASTDESVVAVAIAADATGGGFEIVIEGGGELVVSILLAELMMVLITRQCTNISEPLGGAMVILWVTGLLSRYELYIFIRKMSFSKFLYGTHSFLWPLVTALILT